MNCIDNATSPRFALPGIAHQTLAGRDQGLASLSLWRQQLAPGAATPPHRHDCEEVVLVERGSGELHVDGRVLRFGPDTTLVVPRDASHQILNTGDEPLHLVAAFAAAGFGVTLPDGEPLPLPWPT